MRNVIALGFVSFFTDFSTEMILGILPLFIVTNLGATKAILGAIEGSAAMQKSNTHLDGDMLMIRIQALEWVQGTIQDLILNNVTRDWPIYNDEQVS